MAMVERAVLLTSMDSDGNITRDYPFTSADYIKDLTAEKVLGSNNLGSSTQPIYLSDGKATACDEFVSASKEVTFTQPVTFENGIVVEGTLLSRGESKNEIGRLSLSDLDTEHTYDNVILTINASGTVNINIHNVFGIPSVADINKCRLCHLFIQCVSLEELTITFGFVTPCAPIPTLKEGQCAILTFLYIDATYLLIDVAVATPNV